MDNPGWHAARRAKKESEAFLSPQRGADGRFMPVEQVTPMDESFIGGFFPRAASPAPPLPPKDNLRRRREEPDAHPHPSITPQDIAHRTAVERSRILRVARMHPHLQFMVGPLLRFDTIKDDTWYGAAMVVTSDAGSSYEPFPRLTYSWDPTVPANAMPKTPPYHTKSFELGPHPADPHSTTFPAPVPPEQNGVHSSVQSKSIDGQEIWIYAGNGGTFTFWRFMIAIPLGQHEMAVHYTINNGQRLEFFVPGTNQNMRCASYSCNGFSAGVNPDDFRGPGFQTGYDPCWVDLLEKHNLEPFHALIGGGDQLYCDALTREPEMQTWVAESKPEERKAHPLTDEIAACIDRFFFNHYCQAFRTGAFARANSSIPMINMADDHDIIDGWGSYPEDMQTAPVFRQIGSRGFFFFLLFQCFLNGETDNRDVQVHPTRSLVLGGMGPYVGFRSHSFLSSLGPQVSILMLDCRGERRKEQICSPEEYDKVFAALDQLPETVEHLIVQLGVPIAYPRMVFLETALESSFNPLTMLGRSGSLGLSGFVNKFNADAELLDDLNDHWCAKAHKKERNWLVKRLQQVALQKRVRVSFLSGDVHCGAVGMFKTLKMKNKPEVPPEADFRYMLNIVTSAIANTPPPNAVLSIVNHLSTKTHRTLHSAETDETMIPLFEKDTDGSSRKLKYIMGRRNWAISQIDPRSGDLIWDLRVEKKKGLGETVGYSLRTPPPRWSKVG